MTTCSLDFGERAGVTVKTLVSDKQTWTRPGCSKGETTQIIKKRKDKTKLFTATTTQPPNSHSHESFAVSSFFSHRSKLRVDPGKPHEGQDPMSGAGTGLEGLLSGAMQGNALMGARPFVGRRGRRDLTPPQG